jgi:glycosylphosphatidylinositol phospholipase D
MFLPLAALLVLSVAAPALPCGMSTHTEVCWRAAQCFASADHPSYAQYVREHQDAAQAGADFPDWGYAFDFPDESEAAHWAPFITAFADYVHANSIPPLDEDGERLRAFTLGLVAHSIADIHWHSMEGVEEGFIEAMAQAEFHGDFGASHDVADTDGDFLNDYERGLSELASSWWFPLDDLAAVYQELGYTNVTPDVLAPRTFMLFLGALGQKLAARFLWPFFADNSTFLAEQFLDYFAGGVDSMAIHTMWEWPSYIDIMEDGAPPSASAERAAAAPRPEAFPRAVFAYAYQLWQAGVIEIRSERTARGVLYRATLPHEKKESDPPITGPYPNRRFATNIAESYLGKSIAVGDFDGDGRPDLALGAPGYGEPGLPQLGAVYVFYGKTARRGNDQDVAEADLTLIGEAAFGRFGWSLATVDLNADGLDDLAVGAPTVGADAWRYDGRIVVYFGAAPEGLPAEADATIAGEHKLANWGFALAAFDVNGDGFVDLLAGSPWAKGDGRARGAAAIYLAGAGWTAGAQRTMEQADWLRYGDADYDWFGASLAFRDRGDNGRWLFVGAPGVDQSADEAGMVYGFNLAADDPTAPIFTLAGRGERSKFGWSVAAGGFSTHDRPALAVAAPTESTEGIVLRGLVRLYYLDKLSGSLAVGDIAPAAWASGDSSYARFGWRVAFGRTDSDNHTDFYASGPWAEELRRPMAGMVRGWVGHDDVPPEDIGGYGLLDFYSIYGNPRALYGETMILADVDGDGCDDVLAGSPRESVEARESGSVAIFVSEFCYPNPDDDDDNDTSPTDDDDHAAGDDDGDDDSGCGC